MEVPGGGGQKPCAWIDEPYQHSIAVWHLERFLFSWGLSFPTGYHETRSGALWPLPAGFKALESVALPLPTILVSTAIRPRWYWINKHLVSRTWVPLFVRAFPILHFTGFCKPKYPSKTKRKKWQVTQAPEQTTGTCSGSSGLPGNLKFPMKKPVLQE